jgi:hypothetical protein
MLGAFAGDHLKILVKAGEIIEAAFETKLLDANPVVNKQLACVAYAYFRQELRISLACPGLEIPAKGIGHHPGDGGYILQVDLLCEMPEGIIVDGIDPVVFRFGKIMGKADRGKEMQVIGAGESGETFYEGDDPAHACRLTDLFNQCRNIPSSLALTRIPRRALSNRVRMGFASGSCINGSPQKFPAKWMTVE